MRCPHCQSEASTAFACPTCHFEGNPAQVAELAHLAWALRELPRWELPHLRQETLARQFRARERALEVELGLRAPPFTPEEAAEAWPRLDHKRVLREKLERWIEAGEVRAEEAAPFQRELFEEIRQLAQRLETHRPPTPSESSEQRLARVTTLLEGSERLREADAFASPLAEASIVRPLQEEKARLEDKLRRREARNNAGVFPAIARPGPPPPPRKEPRDFAALAAPEASAPAPPKAAPARAHPAPPPVPAAPRVPLRERFWRTLLSERTLQAMLFLGIFLLFAAALSFVFWGWRDFSAPLRVAIPAAFTALFFGMGHYVRTRTTLHRSGIALSAIAALLIPVDFYTLYANFDIPPEATPSFWLVTSLLCLGAYLVATFAIHSSFFGYLVGGAAGSSALALVELGHQQLGLSLDWRSSALSLLAALLLALAARFRQQAQTPLAGPPLYLLAEPFRALALLTVGVLMPLTFGLRYLQREGYDALHYAVTLNWWVGGLLFGWGAVHYRSRSLGVLAAIALPVSVFLAQAALFQRFSLASAWHAVGWSLLIPLYLVSGRRLLARTDDAILLAHGQTAIRWGSGLFLVATLWTISNLAGGVPVILSYTLLAANAALATYLWQKPRLLYGASALTFLAMTFLMLEIGLAYGQLGIGWATLALIHIVVALNLGRRAPQLAPPIVASGYAIAGLALVPPLFPYNGPRLAYVLGHWLGLAAWGARLAHLGLPGFAARTAAGEEKWPARFHWLTALTLPVWVWILFANRGPLTGALPLTLAALAWGMVLLAYRLVPLRADGVYRKPWYWTGIGLSLVAALAASLIAPDGRALPLAMVAAGLLHLVDAFIGGNPFLLLLGSPILASGYALLLYRLGLPPNPLNFAVALLAAAYLGAGLWTERQRSSRHTSAFLSPLYRSSHLILFILQFTLAGQLLGQEGSRSVLLWTAASEGVLAVAYGFFAWGSYQPQWAYLSVWLGSASLGFLAMAFSRGSGSSAAKAALLAWALILAERGLFYLRQHPRFERRRQAALRLFYSLYRRPLLVTGWAVSAGVIGMALVRNVLLLGGRGPQLWAALALFAIAALYAAGARLFQRPRLVWLTALLVIAPWTILTRQLWLLFQPFVFAEFAIGWLLLAALLYGTGRALAPRVPAPYLKPLRIVALWLIPFSLLWSLLDADVVRWAFPLGIALYARLALDDYWLVKRAELEQGDSKFLYPMLGLIPVWASYLLHWLVPTPRLEYFALLWLSFGGLGLLASQGLRRLAPSEALRAPYALPAYLLAYFSLCWGSFLLAGQDARLAAALLYDAALLALSAWLHRHPAWGYGSAFLLIVSAWMTLAVAGVPEAQQGWWLLGLAAAQVAVAWAMQRLGLKRYGQAPLVVGLGLAFVSLLPSSGDQEGVLWGFSGVALLYIVTALWRRWPLLLALACALLPLPYFALLRELEIPWRYEGLTFFPGAVAALAGGVLLDRHLGRYADFPWGQPMAWSEALVKRVGGWWALAPYVLAFGLVLSAPRHTPILGARAGVYLLLAGVLGWAAYRFRLRIWFLGAVIAGHFAAATWLEKFGLVVEWAEGWLYFLPVFLLTLAIALLIERRRDEGSPLRWPGLWQGWSRPLYLLLFLEGWGIQSEGLMLPSMADVSLTLLHLFLLAGLALYWRAALLGALALPLGALALLQWGAIGNGGVPSELALVGVAGLLLAYGLAGYALRWRRLQQGTGDERLFLWEKPLRWMSLLLSLPLWLLVWREGHLVLRWTLEALLGLRSPLRATYLPVAQMLVGVLALLGLLYLTVTVAHRLQRLSYLALGMLLAAWLLHVYHILFWQRAAPLQAYALPVGLYLLTLGYLEWQRANKTLGRWLDYAAMLLLFGSLFWQTLLFGWLYALMLGAEGLLAFWWGSARRLRRFFYAGLACVLLATVAQLVNSLQSINQWIVFGIIGMGLVVTGVVVERRLEEIKLWREVLETWE